MISYGSYSMEAIVVLFVPWYINSSCHANMKTLGSSFHKFDFQSKI